MRLRYAIVCALFAPTMVAHADDLDDLISRATTKPVAGSKSPATRPVSPFEAKNNPEARPGVITLSNGEKIRGELSTTREKPLRVWDEEKKEYRDLPWSAIKSMQAKVVWERDEPEWHFKESGSDIKEFTGKTYPARELQYTVELANGDKLTGGVVAPLYAIKGDTQQMYVLNKRQKGEVGKSLKDLTYIKRVDMD